MVCSRTEHQPLSHKLIWLYHILKRVSSACIRTSLSSVGCQCPQELNCGSVRSAAAVDLIWWHSEHAWRSCWHLSHLPAEQKQCNLYAGVSSSWRMIDDGHPGNKRILKQGSCKTSISLGQYGDWVWYEWPENQCSIHSRAGDVYFHHNGLCGELVSYPMDRLSGRNVMLSTHNHLVPEVTNQWNCAPI